MKKITLVKDLYEGTTYSRPLSEIVDKLSPGRYDICIVSKGYRISVPQRKLFWMWMAYLESWSGESRRKWYNHYCGMYLLPEHMDINSLTSSQMGTFLEYVKTDALTEWGVLLPGAKDECYNDFVLEFQFK